VRELATRSPEEARRHVRALIDEEAVFRPEDLVLRRLDWTLEREDPSHAIESLEALLGVDALARLRDASARGAGPGR
jgi:hypothetical protein